MSGSMDLSLTSRLRDETAAAAADGSLTPGRRPNSLPTGKEQATARFSEISENSSRKDDGFQEIAMTIPYCTRLLRHA
jgi:hypothetical protein